MSKPAIMRPIEILYVGDDPLNGPMLVVTESATGVRLLPAALAAKPYLAFSLSGERVDMGAAPDASAEVVLVITKELREEIAEACAGRLEAPDPCHYYIDLPDGYTLNISKDEWPRRPKD